MYKIYYDTDQVKEEKEEKEEGLSEEQKEELKRFINERFGRKE